MKVTARAIEVENKKLSTFTYKRKYYSLFALTTDFKFMDMIWDDKEKEFFTFIDIDNKEELFKAVMLSSDATWVKDGDKIEIKLERQWKYSKWTKNFIAKVKCPNCKFYH